MDAYHDELIDAAVRSFARPVHSEPLSQATIRRGVSTIYYALFHFLLDEIGRCLVGDDPSLAFRRHAVGRSISHATLNSTLAKVSKPAPDASVIAVFRTSRSIEASATPSFVRAMASTFADARSKRQEADYDLSAPVSEPDARRLGNRVFVSICDWRAAISSAEMDFKQAVCLLAVIGSRLRSE